MDRIRKSREEEEREAAAVGSVEVFSLVEDSLTFLLSFSPDPFWAGSRLILTLHDTLVSKNYEKNRLQKVSQNERPLTWGSPLGERERNPLK